MNIKHLLRSKLLAGLMLSAVIAGPIALYAKETGVLSSSVANSPLIILIAVAGFVLLCMFLIGAWFSVIDVKVLEHPTLASFRKRFPYLPSILMVTGTIVLTFTLFLSSLKTLGGVAPFSGDTGWLRAAVFFLICGGVGIGAQMLWKQTREYVFASAMGTITAFLLLSFKTALIDSALSDNPYLMSLVIVFTFFAWRMLFGPWSARVKATTLGVFILWIAVHVLWNETPTERMAHYLSLIIALIPALVWMMLFLEYHIQRLSLVLLMFFAGILSTAPILLYDAIVRGGIEFNFFLFRIVPENFNRVSNAFVTGGIAVPSGIRSVLLSSLISFFIVGFIEEISKFWVLQKSGKRFFASIDDVVILSIIVAVGFAFAENVLNPTYFLSFVKEQLIAPESPQWSAFLGNVLGRSVLTNMVHILCSGVLGYFLGLSIFAGPLLEDAHEEGDVHVVLHILHRMFRYPEKAMFRSLVMITGLSAAVVLHGLFNFLVTLPDVLPGHPQTIGDLVGASGPSFLHNISLLLIPSVFYVIGGFWLLSALLLRAENRKQYGRVVTTDTFVMNQMGA